MKRPLFILLCLLWLVRTTAFGSDTERRTYNFNPSWKVFVGDEPGMEREDYEDSGWKSVTLPYAWNQDDAFRLAIDEIPTGVAWYRKTFKIPAEARGQKIFLEFEGLRQAGTVYLNGKELILHENGVMAFGIDITDHARVGDSTNLIAVRTDNDWNYRERSTGTLFQWNNKNFNYGGITKNVYLHITPRVYQTLPLYTNLGTTGVYVYATDIDVPFRSAVIHCESEVKNESEVPRTVGYRVRIQDMDDALVAEFVGGTATLAPGETAVLTAEQAVGGLRFWSLGYGYLYKVTTLLEENGVAFDAVVTRTGFRKTEFGQGMIRLNDRVIQMKGYAQRSSNEWPAVGICLPPWMSDYSNRLIVEGNGNMVRWMHIAPSKQDIESADRVGLIHAMPAGDAEKDVEGRQWEQRVELMRDAIIYNRNHPGILFYECGNKGISEAHMAEMKALRDLYDPHGGRAIGSREMLDSRESEYGGEMLYINKSAGQPLWAMEYCRDEGLRKYWDEQSWPYHKEGAGPLYRDADASDYNHNQDRFAVELIRRWFDYWEARPGTGERVSSGGAKIIFSDSNTHFRGEENYRRSGVVDPMRIPKDAYFAHRTIWDGWVDNERFGTHIVGHWNYPDSTVKDVYVVSGAPGVRLLLNGKTVGAPIREYHFLHTFREVPFEAGTLTAESLDENGNVLSSHTLQTAGEPYALRITALSQRTEPLAADGADMELFEVEVIDREGRRCPLAHHLISFDVSGPAEWRGGIAQGPDNYILARTLPVECGVTRVMVRTTTSPGEVRIEARSDGLSPASARFRTASVPVKDGLGVYFAKDRQASYLEMGETPPTASFTPSRTAIRVSGTEAGANPERAALSYDDNEVTEWSNDGKLATAWIRYTLEREARLSSVCLKLAGWRTRTYPISVSVDGYEVWRGETPRSLGYVTLSFPPTRGREVTVRMVSAAAVKDEFGGIRELDPENDEVVAVDEKAKGQLRIIEAEFYEIP